MIIIPSWEGVQLYEIMEEWRNGGIDGWMVSMNGIIDGWMKLMKAIINGLMDTMNKIMQGRMVSMDG